MSTPNLEKAARSVPKLITQHNCLNSSLLSSSGVFSPSFGRTAALMMKRLPPKTAGISAIMSDVKTPLFPKRNSLETLAF
jgi:hypothetical protein